MRSKTIIIILVSVLTVVLGVLAFLIGTMLGGRNKNAAIEESLPIVTAITTTTEETSTVTTTSETECTTTTTAPVPTITNAYLYWTNTGVGVNLYLHVEGIYTTYEYKLYFSLQGKDPYTLDRTGGGTTDEILVASGLGVPDTFKALVTVWDLNKTQSAEQWVYIDDTHCSNGGSHKDETPSSNRTHLFGGYVDTKNDNLNMRSEPSTTAKIICKIPKGMQLDIYSSGTEGWYWTEYNGKSGYVSAQYIKEIEPYDPSLSIAGHSDKIEIYSCNVTGIISTRGEIVPGFTTSYICEDGAKSMVRTSLGDGWHIQSSKYCFSKNTTWYELYDAWDGDYYGWVAANYLQFD